MSVQFQPDQIPNPASARIRGLCSTGTTGRDAMLKVALIEPQRHLSQLIEACQTTSDRDTCAAAVLTVTACIAFRLNETQTMIQCLDRVLALDGDYVLAQLLYSAWQSGLPRETLDHLFQGAS